MKKTDLKHILDMIECAPVYSAAVEKLFKGENINEYTINDFINEIACEYHCRLAEVMSAVINEVENIRLILQIH